MIEMDIREASDEDLIEALADRGIDVRHIKNFSDTELNNEITRRMQLVLNHAADKVRKGLNK